MKKLKPFFAVLIGAIAAIVILLILKSCSDQRLAPTSEAPVEKVNIETTLQSSASSSSSFLKTVGAPIDKSTGIRWIKNFIDTKPREANSVYYLPASTLKSILSSGGCVGISLFYAVDDSERLAIIPIGTDTNGNVIPVTSIDIQSGGCDWATARRWINAYSGKVKSHFFGAETFNRLLVDQNSPSVRISLAQDDKGSRQLLLSNASEAEPSSYMDYSSPCPPICNN